MLTIQALMRADHLRTLSLFELRMLSSDALKSRSVPPLTGIERLAAAAFVVATEPISLYADPASTARLADWAESAADNLSANQPVPPGPVSGASSPAAAMEPDARQALRAIGQLESEVRRVASAIY